MSEDLDSGPAAMPPPVPPPPPPPRRALLILLGFVALLGTAIAFGWVAGRRSGLAECRSAGRAGAASNPSPSRSR